MLRVASVFTPCCFLLRVVGTGVVAQSLKPVTRVSYVQKDATPNIVGPTMLGVVASVCTLLYLKSFRLCMKKSVPSFISFSSLLTLKFRTYHDIAKMIAIEVMCYVIGGDIFHISWLLSLRFLNDFDDKNPG